MKFNKQTLIIISVIIFVLVFRDIKDVLRVMTGSIYEIQEQYPRRRHRTKRNLNISPSMGIRA